MRQTLCIICLAFLIFGCSKSSDDNIEVGENPTDIGNEGTDLGVELFFPQENMLCNEGTNLTPYESTVFFEWQANKSGNYKIVIENLSTGAIIERETTEDIIPIVIQRATAYSWYVQTKSGGKTEQSATWQFYNAGPGVQSYAPFPAVINAPNMAQSITATTAVTLQWTGNDVDDDIAGYDVYFGTNSTPSLFAGDISATESNVPVTSGTIYYWKIITKDSLGNASDSGIFQFRVL
ncbi:hypothetical protein GCM10023314_31730 [Algibacter agarivorans]|uniref:Fibronectin type-III domain-containing protein n=1 Tax=Algibacter agarivorans TaxID=1109741 RepID=A0ABP9H3T2_9FLAO